MFFTGSAFGRGGPRALPLAHSLHGGVLEPRPARLPRREPSPARENDELRRGERRHLRRRHAALPLPVSDEQGVAESC